MRFSQHLKLRRHHQKHYEFVNLRIDSDNRLFIDPTRIIAEDGEMFERYALIIQDFFDTIFDLYSQGKTSQAKEFFRSSRESNELFLGYSEGAPRGNGNSRIFN